MKKIFYVYLLFIIFVVNAVNAQPYYCNSISFGSGGTGSGVTTFADGTCGGYASCNNSVSGFSSSPSGMTYEFTGIMVQFYLKKQSSGQIVNSELVSCQPSGWFNAYTGYGFMNAINANDYYVRAEFYGVYRKLSDNSVSYSSASARQGGIVSGQTPVPNYLNAYATGRNINVSCTLSLSIDYIQVQLFKDSAGDLVDEIYQLGQFGGYRNPMFTVEKPGTYQVRCRNHDYSGNFAAWTNYITVVVY